MDSDIRQRLSKAAEELGSTPAHAYPSARPSKPSRRRKKILDPAGAIVIVIVCLLGVGGYMIFRGKDTSTAKFTSIVPGGVQKSVSFPVYHPDPAKLPTGYTLDKDSFNASNNVVVYSVNYDTNKKIAFTIQKKPTEDELKAFYTSQIPIRNEVTVPAGVATIGVLNDQTFVSLPTNSEAWLLITAPKDLDPNQLKQTLQAISVTD